MPKRDHIPGSQYEAFVRPEYCEYHPPNVEHDCVEAVWSFRPSKPADYLVLPDGRVDLLTRFTIEPDDAVSHIRLIVAGPARCSSTVPATPHTGFLGMRFRPGWGAICLGLDPQKLRDASLLSDEVVTLLGPLAAPILKARTVSGLQQSLLTVALSLAARLQLDHRSARAAAAIRLLHDRDGECAIATLAHMMGVSARTLHRDIVATAGVPAKSLAAVFRFQRSMRILHINPSHNLAQLAAEAGYSDQSHMTREFRQLGGFTPAVRPQVPVINTAQA